MYPSPFPLVPFISPVSLGTRNAISLYQVLHDPKDKSHEYVALDSDIQ